jgi:hypothetical protein
LLAHRDLATQLAPEIDARRATAVAFAGLAFRDILRNALQVVPLRTFKAVIALLVALQALHLLLICNAFITLPILTAHDWVPEVALDAIDARVSTIALEAL